MHIEGTIVTSYPMGLQVLEYVQSHETDFVTFAEKDDVLSIVGLYYEAVSDDNLYGKVNFQEVEFDLTGVPLKLEAFAGKKVKFVCETDNRKTEPTTTESEEVVPVPTVNEELQQIVDGKVDEKVFGEDTEQEIKSRIEYMFANMVDVQIVEEVVSRYRKYNRPCHTPKTMYVDPYLNGKRKESKISEGLRCALYNIPAVCEGDKSVGKNVFMETIAWLLGMPLYTINFSRYMDPDSVYGEKITLNHPVNVKDGKRGFLAEAMSKLGILAQDKEQAVKDMAISKMIEIEAMSSPRIGYKYSGLASWLEDGGVMVWNEMNMAESNFFSSFANPLTDGTGFLTFPGEKGRVDVHPDCVLFGTQNRNYEGTMTQNEATMSRFCFIEFEQPEDIIPLLKEAVRSANARSRVKSPDVEDKFYRQAQQFYSECLTLVRDGRISNNVLNIRGIVAALRFCENGKYSLAESLENCVINACPETEKDDIMLILHRNVM